jgi:hypothetical protein
MPGGLRTEPGKKLAAEIFKLDGLVSVKRNGKFNSARAVFIVVAAAVPRDKVQTILVTTGHRRH